MPPRTPEPSHISQIWCSLIPIAEMTRPPHQHSAETTPALRGPTRSSQPPQMAAEEPRNTKKRVYIQPSVEIFQSQFEAKSSVNRLMSAGHASGCVMPMARESGSQNTEK